MKKIVFIVLFIVSTIVVSAQAEWFTTSHFSVTPVPRVEWSEWTPVEILVSIDIPAKRIVIFSDEQQIIDVQSFVKKTFPNCDAYGSYATDTNYGLIYVSLYFFTTGEVQLEIQYSDVAYKYQFKNVNDKQRTFY